MKSHIKIKMESETPLKTTERNSPGQVWSTARNSPGQKPPSRPLKEIPPDKSCLQREIPLDYSENPRHQPMTKEFPHRPMKKISCIPIFTCKNLLKEI